MVNKDVYITHTQSTHCSLKFHIDMHTVPANNAAIMDHPGKKIGQWLQPDMPK